jgi:hypothetical protein
VSSAQHAARRDDSDSHGADDAFDDSDSDDSDSDGADDSDSDAFAAEPNEGPGAALADSSSHELSDGDAAACSAAYGSAVLRHCQRALQLLHDGGVRASTAAAAAPDARAGPFPLSDLILLARAAACRAAVPQLPTAARVRQACLRAGVQAVDVIVNALDCIRSAIKERRRIDRRRLSQRAQHSDSDDANDSDSHGAVDAFDDSDSDDSDSDGDGANDSDSHVQQARPRQNVLRVRPRRHVSGVDARVAAGARTA